MIASSFLIYQIRHYAYLGMLFSRYCLLSIQTNLTSSILQFVLVQKGLFQKNCFLVNSEVGVKVQSVGLGKVGQVYGWDDLLEGRGADCSVFYFVDVDCPSYQNCSQGDMKVVVFNFLMEEHHGIQIFNIMKQHSLPVIERIGFINNTLLINNPIHLKLPNTIQPSSPYLIPKKNNHPSHLNNDSSSIYRIIKRNQFSNGKLGQIQLQKKKGSSTKKQMKVYQIEPYRQQYQNGKQQSFNNSRDNNFNKIEKLRKAQSYNKKQKFQSTLRQFTHLQYLNQMQKTRLILQDQIQKKNILNRNQKKRQQSFQSDLILLDRQTYRRNRFQIQDPKEQQSYDFTNQDQSQQNDVMVKNIQKKSQKELDQNIFMKAQKYFQGYNLLKYNTKNQISVYMNIVQMPVRQIGREQKEIREPKKAKFQYDFGLQIQRKGQRKGFCDNLMEQPSDSSEQL